MSDVVIVALVSGCVSFLCMLVPLIMNSRSSLHKKVDTLAADVKAIRNQQTEMGDIVYQMLDHMATNNNTGNMKRCLDQYNEFNRHN